MKHVLQNLILILLIVGCNSAYKNINKGFVLKGKTNGLKNETLVYLKDAYSNKLIDSIKVQNNKFEFRGKLEDYPVQVYIIADSLYRSVWLENNSMVFDASNIDFRNAKIKGSDTQILADQFNDSTSDIQNFFELEEASIKFIEEHPNSIISAQFLCYSLMSFEKPKVEELYNQFTAENKENVYSQEIENFLELSKNPQIGEQYVDFEMQDDSGNNIYLSEKLGKVTLLEFWASWCGPCRAKIPNLIKTYNEFKDKGFEIISVSTDDDNDRWKTAMEEDKAPWIQLSDLKGPLNKARLIYGIDEIPDNFLINEEGEIIGRNLKGEDLMKELEKLFE